MKTNRIALAALATATLVGCGGGATANNTGRTVPPPPEEGYDPNMVIGGDEITPLPEDDGTLGNVGVPGNVIGNGATRR